MIAHLRPITQRTIQALLKAYVSTNGSCFKSCGVLDVKFSIFLELTVHYLGSKIDWKLDPEYTQSAIIVNVISPIMSDRALAEDVLGGLIIN